MPDSPCGSTSSRTTAPIPSSLPSKNFFGLYDGHGVSFEDKAGNTLIARYENFENNMPSSTFGSPTRLSRAPKRILPTGPRLAPAFELAANVEPVSRPSSRARQDTQRFAPDSAGQSQHLGRHRTILAPASLAATMPTATATCCCLGDQFSPRQDRHRRERRDQRREHRRGQPTQAVEVFDSSVGPRCL